MTDLLQRLQRARPGILAWMDDLHATHRQASVPASATGYARLASAFPASLLQRARAVAVDRVPFPPVSAYGLPEFESMERRQIAGVTFDDMYFVHRAHASEATHFHELVHVVQWSTLGVDEFLLTYALGVAQHGYVQSPLEAIAFDLQALFEQHAALDGVVDRVARHAVETRDAAAAVFRAHGFRLGS
ncbi:MAG: hypothetical protein AB7G23_18565 [Vicinamibacterales bacterium]